MTVEILPSVVDDSKISFIKCRRHILGAIQSALSCG